MSLAGIQSCKIWINWLDDYVKLLNVELDMKSMRNKTEYNNQWWSFAQVTQMMFWSMSAKIWLSFEEFMWYT